MKTLPQAVKDEVLRHNIGSLKALSIDHEAVTMAISYLMTNGYEEMARSLRQAAMGHRIRVGPFDGFVAVGLQWSGEEYVLLSDAYPEYNAMNQMTVSLVQEVGNWPTFKYSDEENEARGEKALEWYAQKRSYQAPAPTSVIATAAQKTEQKTDRKSKASLIDVLLQDGYITDEQMRDARDKQLGAKKPLHDLLVEMGFISDEDLAKVFSKVFEMPIGTIDDKDVDPETIKLLKFDIMRRFSVFPIRQENGFLVLAMSNPRDLGAIEEVSEASGLEVKPVLVTRSEIYRKLDGLDTNDDAINGLINNMNGAAVVHEVAAADDGVREKLTTSGGAQAKDILSDMEAKEKPVKEKAIAFPNLPPEYEVLLLQETPTVKLVNLILGDAIKLHASDVHVEPRENLIEIRYRLDGDLKNIMQIPMKFHPKVVARVKILANLDITQNMLPQDGRIQLEVDGRKVDFRVSTIPTFYGEKVVIRILDAASAKTDLKILGLNPDERVQFEEAIKSPQGMVLVTGPTGSGKTSTLYAALNFVKNESTNIVTIEDPIEFINEGINQIQVNPARGVTFASGLRSILRQDPNVILLGEIRDKETADIALKASITGHLLLSTLHTNSCIATITRLADIGMDYYQISSALIMVVSQRLVKTICKDCKAEHVVDDEYKSKYKDEFEEFKLTKIFKGKGCQKCNFSGYKGRTAVYEVLKITEDLKNIIAKGLPEEEILKVAQKGGFKKLIEAGFDKVKDGVTTIEEVIKHIGNVERSKVAQGSADAEGHDAAPALDPNRKRKILIVDDEDDIRKIVAKYLTAADYDVVQAIHGQQAIEMVFKEKPDLIVTDVMMPIMDGIEATKVLRSSVETAVIPIIMLTAKQDKETELAGLNVGADDYITKPFDKEKLLARIAMLLRRGNLKNA